MIPSNHMSRISQLHFLLQETRIHPCQTLDLNSSVHQESSPEAGNSLRRTMRQTFQLYHEKFGKVLPAETIQENPIYIYQNNSIFTNIILNLKSDHCFLHQDQITNVQKMQIPMLQRMSEGFHSIIYFYG